MTGDRETKKLNVSCINKVRYETKEFAENAFKGFVIHNTHRRGKNIGGKKIKQYPYKCEYCRGWHLTTRK